MSQKTTSAPADDNDRKPETIYVASAKATHRAVGAIADDLDAARVKFHELEPRNRDYAMKRERAVERRRKREAEHKAQDPDSPFDPEAYNPPAVIPPLEGPVSREFHRLHYTIAGLETELEAAKKAVNGL